MERVPPVSPGLVLPRSQVKGRTLKGSPPKIRDTMPAILRVWKGFEQETLIARPCNEIRQYVVVEDTPMTATFTYLRHEAGVPVFVMSGFEPRDM